jgi:hypothetical protein
MKFCITALVLVLSIQANAQNSNWPYDSQAAKTLTNAQLGKVPVLLNGMGSLVQAQTQNAMQELMNPASWMNPSNWGVRVTGVSAMSFGGAMYVTDFSDMSTRVATQATARPVVRQNPQATVPLWPVRKKVDAEISAEAELYLGQEHTLELWRRAWMESKADYDKAIDIYEVSLLIAIDEAYQAPGKIRRACRGAYR